MLFGGERKDHKNSRTGGKDTSLFVRLRTWEPLYQWSGWCWGLATFQGSVENYSVRCTKYLGDEVSKAYKRLVVEAVYGNEKRITKPKCVGHVHKHLGMCFRFLKTTKGSNPSSEWQTKRRSWKA